MASTPPSQASEKHSPTETGTTPTQSRKSDYKGGYGIPWVLGRNGRFCPHCGRSVRNFFDQYQCPHVSCQRLLLKNPPHLPSGYIWCMRCRVGWIKSNHRNCMLCRQVTEYGMELDKLLERHQKAQSALHSELLENIKHLQDSDTGTRLDDDNSEDKLETKFPEILHESKEVKTSNPENEESNFESSTSLKYD